MSDVYIIINRKEGLEMSLLGINYKKFNAWVEKYSDLNSIVSLCNGLNSWELRDIVEEASQPIEGIDVDSFLDSISLSIGSVEEYLWFFLPEGISIDRCEELKCLLEHVLSFGEVPQPVDLPELEII